MTSAAGTIIPELIPELIHLNGEALVVVSEQLVTAWDASPPYQYTMLVTRPMTHEERER